MKVLQLCNGFAASKVHSNLYRCLDDLGIEQTIYTTVYNTEEIGKNKFIAKNAIFVYSNIMRNWLRFFYHIKKYIIKKDISRRVNISEYDCVHAVTLFTDGAQAYELNKKYGIPYIVTVRNTDVNLFLEKAPHTWRLGKKVLVNATKILFISKAAESKFAEHKVIKPLLDDIKGKFFVQPNGIDPFWHNNITHIKNNPKNILYVGDFSLNKNVSRLLEAVIKLKEEKEFNDVHLNIVGGGNSKHGFGKNANRGDEITMSIINQHPETVTYLGPIYDKSKLKDVYRQNGIFAMPSIHETFGLVYVEALSQNLPVVYTKNQGIDKMFDKSVGIAVNPLSVEDIYHAIKSIILKYDDYSNQSVNFTSFDWNIIARNYLSLYNDIVFGRSI